MVFEFTQHGSSPANICWSEGFFLIAVIKIFHTIGSKAAQHKEFKVLLRFDSWAGAEYCSIFFFFVTSGCNKKKSSRSPEGEDATLQWDTDWMMDFAFLTDITRKLNHLNREVQGKGKSVWHDQCCEPRWTRSLCICKVRNACTFPLYTQD